MSFKYPDFSTYFAGPQLLPTEIMMMIHDWGRANIKLRGANLPNKQIVIMGDNTVYNIAPGTKVSINPHYYDLDEPFIYCWFGSGYLYLEYHDLETLVVRRVYRDTTNSYSFLRRESLFPNGKVLVRCGGPRRFRTFEI